ncbi:MAG: RluA family pseudouridine synthase [Anaerolineae bacterium]
MTTPQQIAVEAHQPPTRLDQYLADALPHLSRSQIKKLIQQNKILVAHQPAKPGAVIGPGDVIQLDLPDDSQAVLAPEPMALDIVHADEAVILINKPPGLVVHPAHGHSGGTLVNGLLAQFPDLTAMTTADSEAAFRPGVVHRLDQDTSGLIVIARTPEALRRLRRQFKSRTVEKTYLAVVFGQPEAPEGVIDVPLGRDPRQRQKFAPRLDGKPARTHYRLKEALDGYSLLEIGLETGRTHQIRVHLAWLKCPVVGDTVYGRKKTPPGVERQLLHAWRLAFIHPLSGDPVRFEAPLPADMRAALARLAG